jgi:hypothetical protein
MGIGERQIRDRMRGACLALAFAALLVKLMVPVGFMAAEGPTAQAFPLVICTAQGRVALPASTEHAPAHKSKADAPCAFAANAAPPAPAAIAILAAPFRAAPLAVREARADLQPGRGLAAPPPPSQGPPSVLI